MKNFYATGVKLKKTVTDGNTSQITNTHYSGGFQYTEDHLDFFPHAEGYVNVIDYSAFHYVYTYKDHLGNIRLKYTLDPDTNETAILEENHYYPYGLTHQGYNADHKFFFAIDEIIELVEVTSNRDDKYKYKFNSREWQTELNLNVYDLGARHYNPALGRFMVIDPMADFVNYQSPYVMADNNPVMSVDEYGLGILRAIGNLFSRAAFGAKKLFSGKSCDCRKFQGESLRDAWNMPDFPGNNNRRSSRSNNRNSQSRTTTTSNQETSSQRKKLSPINLPSSQGIISFGMPEPNLPSLRPPVSNPKPSIPEFDGKFITRPLTYNADVKYNSSSSKFRDIGHTEETLSKLIKTLKEYPQLKVLILGNFVNDTPNLTKDSRARVNGKEGTVGGLQLERARAVERFLIERGIDWRRITVGHGEILPSGINNMNSSIIITNPQN